MIESKTSAVVKDLTDEDVLEEAARRLQKQYADEHGVDFSYGTFRFVFHDGRFQGVEDWPRNKRDVSPKRNNSETK